MMKLFIIACALIPIISFSKGHTGELLYKLKDHKNQKAFSHHIVEVYKPHQKSVEDLETIRQKMLATGKYKFVEYNTFETTANLVEGTDPELDKQWQHQNIETKLAWDYTLGSKDTIVAVCDSGIEAAHEDLKKNTLPGHSFLNNDQSNTPTTSHGTFVAGLIAAEINNNLGVAGVAPKVKVLPLKIANTKGGSSLKKIVDCIKYAADYGVQVINVSFTGVNSMSVEEAGIYARERGALLVYSAGNQGKNRRSYPDHAHVLIVGATNKQDKRWTYRKNFFQRGGSNYGPFIDVVAPGHKVYSTHSYITQGGDKYRSGSGTSYSAPIVSAIAALIFSINPELTPDEVEKIINLSTDIIGDEYYYGAGRVNAYQAVKLALQSL